jgi:hypothetical protein
MENKKHWNEFYYCLIMRIPDEQQIFQVGDKVETIEGQAGVVVRISSCNVYYEARPIASYTQYNYIIDIDGKTHSLKLDQIITPQ